MKWFINKLYKQWSPTNKIFFWLGAVGVIGLVLTVIFFAIPQYQASKEISKKDSQVAEIYKTNINHFLVDFKVCLHWTLPVGENTDKEIDGIFNYGLGVAKKEIDLDNLQKEVVRKIFTNYQFERVMPNYVGNFPDPTGFKNLLGILDYFDEQLGDLLNKYGGSTSPELSTRIEYMQRNVASVKTAIRLDLLSNGRVSKQTIDSLADFFILIRNDYLYIDSSYQSFTGSGYPIMVGKVTKNDPQNGEMLYETRFSEY